MAKKRAGKYAHVIGDLPRLPMVEPERKDLVDAVKAEMLTPPSDADVDCDVADTIQTMQTLVTQLLQYEKHAAANHPYAAEFARVYAELRSIKATMDGWLSSLNLLIEAYEVVMVQRMEAEGLSAVRLSNGQPVSWYHEPYGKIVDAEAFRLWCLKKGFERKMCLPWATMNAHVKELLLAGEPEPDGVMCGAMVKVRLGGEK